MTSFSLKFANNVTYYTTNKALFQEKNDKEEKIVVLATFGENILKIMWEFYFLSSQ